MRYIHRSIEEKIKQGMERYACVTVFGPRQAGKTTMVRNLFPDFTYVNLEDPDAGDLARNNPKKFFETYHEPMIIDEIQEAPKLTGLIQYRADTLGRKGQFVLTGSRQLALKQTVSQSLVGRNILFWLQPLSLDELQSSGLSVDRNTLLFTGMYRLFMQRCG